MLPLFTSFTDPHCGRVDRAAEPRDCPAPPGPRQTVSIPFRRFRCASPTAIHGVALRATRETRRGTPRQVNAYGA